MQPCEDLCSRVYSNGYTYAFSQGTLLLLISIVHHICIEESKINAFRRKGYKHYQLLGEIFNTITAMGQLHYASTQKPSESEKERQLEEEFLNAGVHADATRDGYKYDVSGPTPTRKEKRCRSTSDPERARGSRSKSNESEMSSAFKA